MLSERVVRRVGRSRPEAVAINWTAVPYAGGVRVEPIPSFPTLANRTVVAAPLRPVRRVRRVRRLARPSPPPEPKVVRRRGRPPTWGKEVEERVLEILKANPAERLADISRRVGLPQKKVYSIVRSLERRGLIERPKVRRRRGEELARVLNAAVEEYFGNPKAKVKEIAEKYGLSFDTLYRAIRRKRREAGGKLKTRWEAYREAVKKRVEAFRRAPVEALLKSVFEGRRYAGVRAALARAEPVIKDVVRTGNLAEVARRHRMSLLDAVKYYVLAKALSIPRAFKEVAGLTPTEAAGYYRQPVKTTVVKRFNELARKARLKELDRFYTTHLPDILHRIDRARGLINPREVRSGTAIATRHGVIDVADVAAVGEALVLRKGVKAVPKRVEARIPEEAVEGSATVRFPPPAPEDFAGGRASLTAVVRGRRLALIEEEGGLNAVALMRLKGKGVELPDAGGKVAAARLWPLSPEFEAPVIKALASGPVKVVAAEGVPMLTDVRGRFITVLEAEPLERGSFPAALLTLKEWPLKEVKGAPHAEVGAKALLRKVGGADALTVEPAGDGAVVRLPDGKPLFKARGGKVREGFEVPVGPALKWFLRRVKGKVKAYVLDDALLLRAGEGDLILFGK